MIGATAEMAVCRGVHLPDGDTHFADMIRRGPIVNGRGTYQYDTWQRVIPYLADVSRQAEAVDVGAHVGLWTIAMLEWFAHVTAFEPMNAYRLCVLDNLRDRLDCDITDRVTLHGVALGARASTVQLHEERENSRHTHVAGPGESAMRPPVTQHTLDSYALRDVRFLKIACEGYERDIVDGAEQTIRRDRPVMLVEQKPGQATHYGFADTAAVSLLESWGATVAWEQSGDYLLVWD